jgi:hypothetical protein
MRKYCFNKYSSNYLDFPLEPCLLHCHKFYQVVEIHEKLYKRVEGGIGLPNIQCVLLDELSGHSSLQKKQDEEIGVVNMNHSIDQSRKSSLSISQVASCHCFIVIH